MQLRSVYTELTRRLINKEELLHVRTLHPDGRLVDGFVPKEEAWYCYILEDEILNHNHPCIIKNNNLPTILFHQFKPEERVDSFEDLSYGRHQAMIFRNSSGSVVVQHKLLNKFKPDPRDGLTYTMFPKAHTLYIYDSETKKQVGTILGIKISEEASHEK